jgi:hypothetical protein
LPQILLADTSLHASRASAAALTPFLGLGASSSTPAARDAMLRHPEAFAALTSVRVRLSDLLDRESRDEMLEVRALAFESQLFEPSRDWDLFMRKMPLCSAV